MPAKRDSWWFSGPKFIEPAAVVYRSLSPKGKAREKPEAGLPAEAP